MEDNCIERDGGTFPRPVLTGRGCRAGEAGEAGEGQREAPHPARFARHLLPASGEKAEKETLPQIAANPYVLQELAKEPGTREHEIISYRRRHIAKPHGYPLSGRDRAGKRVLFHSDEKEKFGAGEA